MKRLLLMFAAVLLFALVVDQSAYAQKEGYGNETGGGEPNEAASDSIPAARDGVYDKISTKEKQILAYDHLREADIFWQKRIWRVIDTRQKLNHPFTYPEMPFISVLLKIVEEEDVRVYMDDYFKEGMTLSEVESQLGSVDTIRTIDMDTYEEITKVVKNDFNWMSVTKFRLKEDWVFDEETSTMLCRIIGIAPIMDVYDDNDNYRGQKAMFWAYYPDFRDYLIKYETFNPHNDAIKMTWEDIFEMRYFSSYIMKEANMQDRRIKDYATGKDALFESDRIKEEIFLKEHDLWSY